MTVTLRPAAARGQAHHGWLETHHSFSFANYFDPAQMGFRALRVINEDRIAPRTGFATHGHREMEILTYVFAGALEHRDSTGGQAVIRRGEVQRMSAGTGVRHSEMNPSAEEAVDLLQIWLLPETDGLPPSYQQSLFPEAVKQGRLCLLAAPDRLAGAARDQSLTLHADAAVYAALLAAGDHLAHPLAAGRGAWVQVISGRITVNGRPLAAGDGAAVEDSPSVEIAGIQAAELLLFDLG